ncbi:MAG: RHS repeat-associated core domain-containing protein [Lachnospiraceae bacterium]|nr:RHS repeat-associated core domain-containing protein [Lachnospiraceae bacterium]
MIDGNGLYYMRARYYNVDIKRFINQDVLVGTLERISSLNRFSYVEGNPISFLDPFGLETARFNQVINELHNIIAHIQVIILVAEMAVTSIGIIATSTGNVAVAAGATSLFAKLYFFSTMLAGIDASLYTMQAWNPNNTDKVRYESATKAIITLLSMLSPVKKIMGTDMKLSDVQKLVEIANSVKDWMLGEAANIFENYPESVVE